MSKLFAFTGLDMGYGGLDVLRRAIKDDCRILPLDTEAIGFAVREGVGYTTIDEWLGDARKEACRLAHEAETRWFETGREAFTSDGVCWPEFDHHAMHYFWQEVFLSQAIAEGCRQRGVKELRFRRIRQRRASVDYRPARMYGNVWEKSYPEIRRAANLPVRRQLHWQAARALRLAGTGLRRLVPRSAATSDATEASRHPVPPAQAMGEIAFALNWAELDRFGGIIRHLAEGGGQRVVVRLLTDAACYPAQFAGKFPVQVYAGPSALPHSPKSGEMFLRGLDSIAATSKGAPWEQAVRHLRFHFEHYCRERWPHLEGQYKAWIRLWDHTRPAAVVVSNLMDAGSQLPAMAARGLGIPSLSVSHGAGMVRFWDAIAAERVLYDLGTQRVVYAQSGITPTRLFPCRGLVVQDEYDVTDAAWVTDRGKMRVLALTDPIAPTGCLAGWIGHGVQIGCLRALATCPDTLASRLDIRFKGHPGWPDTELFEAAGVKVATSLFPASARLGPLLAAADLVIAVNYCGGALVHALRAGKPVLLFWLDPLLHGKHDFWHPEVYSTCGPMARTADELWSLLRRFVEHPETAVRMRSKADAYRREFLDDHAHPSLVDEVRVLTATWESGSAEAGSVS